MTDFRVDGQGTSMIAKEIAQKWMDDSGKIQWTVYQPHQNILT